MVSILSQSMTLQKFHLADKSATIYCIIESDGVGQTEIGRTFVAWTFLSSFCLSLALLLPHDFSYCLNKAAASL